VHHRNAQDLAPQLRELLSGLNDNSLVLVDQELNRLVVQGGEQTQQLAAQLVQALDRVVARPAAEQPQPTVVRGYPTPDRDPQQVAAELKQAFPGIRAEPDPRTRQVIVLATEEQQQQINQRLQGRPLPAAAAAGPEPQTRDGHQLENISWREFEDQLRQLWGPQLQLTTSRNGEIATVVVASTNGATPVMQIDRRLDLVTFEGSPTVTSIWRQIVRMLDTVPRPDERTQLISLGNANPEHVERTIRLIQGINGRAANDQVTAAVPLPQDRRPWAGNLVDVLFQPQGQAAPEAAQPAPQPGAQPPAPGDAPLPAEGVDTEGAGLLGSVQIEVIPGVGLLLKGRAADVAKVRALIDEILDVAKQTRPFVEVFPLQYVNSEALATLVQDIYDEIYEPRQGAVAIRALVEPNALLLIGSQEAVDAVKELLGKLDQPMAPASRFEVLRLKFVSAQDAETAIRNFFVAQPPTDTAVRPGLGTRVRVIADYRTNTLIVQASPRDLEEVKRFIETLDTDEAGHAAEVRIFKLRNALAEDLAETLQSAITGQGATTQGQQQPGGGLGGGATGQTQGTSRLPSPNLEFIILDTQGGRLLRGGLMSDVSITADASTNALVVRAPAKSMELIATLIEQLDQLPDAEAQIKVFTIVNGDASSLAAMLQQLFGQQVTIGQGTGGGFGAAFRQAQLPTTTAGGDSSLVPLTFAIDVRTNSILVSGSASDLDVVEALLLRLDEAGVNTNVLQVVRLKNTASDAVATAVQQYIQNQQLNLQNRLTLGQAITPFEQLEREIIVISEPQSNSVVVSASPRYMDEIMQVIKDLDYRQPMVMVQVVIAEVRLDDLFEFGVEWGLQDSLLYDRGIPGVASTPGFNFNNAQGVSPGSSVAVGSPFLPNLSNAGRGTVAGQGLSNFALGRVSEAGYGGLVLSAASDSVSALLRALEQNGMAQILSRPQIMALNNREAFVQVGQTVARITGSTINNTGQVTNSVQDVETGLILAVVPTINEDDVIHMFVLAERSFLGNENDQGSAAVATDALGNEIRAAPINRQQAQTTVSCRSGQTVVFAGLISKENETEVRRVPYVSDIPVIGHLFQFEQTAQRRSELLIVMTPYIIREDADYDWIKLMESERMSWCLSDVIELHGDVGLAGSGGPWNSSETPLIMPSDDPTGGVVAPAPEPGPLESSRRDEPLRPVTYGAPLPGPQTIRPAALGRDPGLHGTPVYGPAPAPPISRADYQGQMASPRAPSPLGVAR